MPDHLPLREFFERLRQNNFPLGVDDYQRLLEALKLSMGLGVAEFNSLNEAFLRKYLPASEFETTIKPSILRICKLLWLKPDQSTQLFEEIFNATFNLGAGIFEATENAPSPPDMVVINKHRDLSGPRPPAIQAPRPPEVSSQELAGLPQLNIASEEPIRVRIDLGTRTGEDLSLASKSIEVEKNKFLFTTNYFPVDLRKIQQNLRAYPTFRQVLSTTEVDLEATVDHTTKRGFFEKVIFKGSRISTAQFVFLIDNGGSMVAFRPLALLIRDELLKAFSSKEAPGEEVMVRYFNPKSSKKLYADQAGTAATELDAVIARLNPKSATVIFFSDAGAAASTHDQQLVKVANSMIEKIKLRTRKIVWINPLPKHRWKHTTAKKISETVVMFEANESGIKGAVDYLRGASVRILKPAG